MMLLTFEADGETDSFLTGFEGKDTSRKTKYRGPAAKYVLRYSYIWETQTSLVAYACD